MHSLLEKVFPLHLSVKRINMQLREYGYIRFALIIFFFEMLGILDWYWELEAHLHETFS